MQTAIRQIRDPSRGGGDMVSDIMTFSMMNVSTPHTGSPRATRWCDAVDISGISEAGSTEQGKYHEIPPRQTTHKRHGTHHTAQHTISTCITNTHTFTHAHTHRAPLYTTARRRAHETHTLAHTRAISHEITRKTILVPNAVHDCSRSGA